MFIDEPNVRMMSEVTRWGIVPNLRRQSIADHSYYVCLYALDLCNVLGLDARTAFYITQWCLLHDLPETVTGDIVGPVKRRTVDKDKLAEFETSVYRSYQIDGDGIRSQLSERDIWVVKAANLIDEVWYRAWEAAMGNRIASMEDSVFRMH